jgi:Cytochrome c7 and related cytochrome c
MNKAQHDRRSSSSKDGRAVVPPTSRHWPLIFFSLVLACGVLGVFWIGKTENDAMAAGKNTSVASRQSSISSSGRSMGNLSSQSPSAGQSPANERNAGDSGVFTPAHGSLEEAVRDFFDIYPTPVQPIAFNHQIHLAKGMKCTACHAGVTQGPDAGIPSVTFCMACHQVIATSNPEIRKLAAYAAKGQDVPWQPVNWFYPSAHVRFWHAPHIRAGVDCSACHGDMSQETVAVRKKNLTMNFCLSCHREKGVSVDCTTCHD